MNVTRRATTLAVLISGHSHQCRTYRNSGGLSVLSLPHFRAADHLYTRVFIDSNAHDAIDTSASGFDTRKEIQVSRSCVFDICSASSSQERKTISHMPEVRPDSQLRRDAPPSSDQAGGKSHIPNPPPANDAANFSPPCQLPHSQEIVG